jgi:hypothetical protein
MIVQRNTVRYKVGKVQEANALLIAERARLLEEKRNLPQAYRYYSPLDSDVDVSIGEYEFETSEEMDKFWNNWNAQPEAQAFLEKYNALTEGEMVTEYFNLF